VSVQGVTLTVRTALAATLTDAAVTCLAYDEWDISSGSLATVGSARWEMNDGDDQRTGIRAIVFDVFVYQVIDGGFSQSMAYMETAVEKIMDGLASDRTLGSKVAYADVSGDAVPSFNRIPNGQVYAVTTIPVRVMPFPNRGA
jgi:hypothetical protein